MKARKNALLPLILALGFAGPALATEAGDGTLSVGAHVVDPIVYGLAYVWKF